MFNCVLCAIGYSSATHHAQFRRCVLRALTLTRARSPARHLECAAAGAGSKFSTVHFNTARHLFVPLRSFGGVQWPTMGRHRQ